MSSRVSTYKYGRNTTLVKTEAITKDSFKIIRRLGKGSYGTVYLVEKKDTRVQYAMKEISKEQVLSLGKKTAVYRERDILEMVSEHPNAIHLELTF